MRQAARDIGGAICFVADIDDPFETCRLRDYMVEHFGRLDILVNNAGRGYINRPGGGIVAALRAADEMQTNFLSIVRLTEELLPLLWTEEETAIVNVSDVVAFVPNGVVSTYSASKAALHSYTQSLRHSLESDGDKIRVFELIPSLVNTEFSKNIGGAKGMSPVAVADSLIQALETNVYEIYIGEAKKAGMR